MTISLLVFFLLFFHCMDHSDARLLCPSSIEAYRNSTAQWCFILSFDDYTKFHFLNNKSTGFLDGVMSGCDAALQDQNNILRRRNLTKLADSVIEQCNRTHQSAGLKEGKGWRAAFCCYDKLFSEPISHCSTWFRLLHQTTTTTTPTSTMTTTTATTSTTDSTTVTSGANCTVNCTNANHSLTEDMDNSTSTSETISTSTVQDTISPETR